MTRTTATQSLGEDEAVPAGSRYLWACPYCETSRSSSGAVDAEIIRGRATNAVHGHVSASTGDGHGPQYSVPDDFDPADHIERVL